MDPKRTVSPETALASDIFDKFCSANTLKGILSQYRQLCCVLRIKPTHFPDFYPRLRAKLSSWRAQGLWSKFEKRATQKCYGRGKACFGTRVLIIGAGPCGLRAAIEAQLLGAKVVLVEKRDRFSRNNVLHLWPFVITDLKALGAKKFYGKFCAGSIDHISIRQLQCILLKVALLLGVEVHEGVGFEGLREPCENEGWRAVTSPADHPVSHYTFDVLIGADGRRNTLEGFKRKALRAKLAIAITANFINKHTEAEARVKEISGVSYIFNQKFFNDLCEATGIDLENIVYYKDETHYFVMTAKKQSLLNKGVLLQDYADTAKLLSHENISSEALMLYALEAAMFATEYQLPDIEFAVNHYGQPDVAMFDFTAMYAAENACRVVQTKGHKLLMTLVGDSLLEPFWPTGSGCARGFLSSFDACWMLRSWTGGVKSVLEVVAERESIYRLLGQTTPENLQKEHIAYTIDPHTRYPNLNLRLVMPFQVKSLYEADEKILDVPDGTGELIDNDKAPKKRRRDSVIAVDSLLSWLRDQVSCYTLEINDVRDAFVRGDVLCAIVHRFRPDLIDYPLPSEENIEPLIAAAFQNQLAFDILHQEYGLPHAMSGYESVQFVSSDFLTLAAYLSQVYEIFRGEIPQTKYLRAESGDELDDPHHRPIDHLQSLKELRMAVTAKHHFNQKSTGRRNRLSSNKESRDGDSEHYRRHKKRRSDERRAGSSTDALNSESSENGKVPDRLVDSERYIKSLRLLQLSQRSGPIENDDEDDDDEDSPYRDYTFFLYRQTVPDFDERCKTLEQKLTGRGLKTVFGKSLGEGSYNEKMVPGMAKDLEAKLKGRSSDRQKPKDLIRAIGKIEKSDWNVQLIEKKMAEIKDSSSGKKDRDNKVPKWSREAFDDKREAMKRKMDGGAGTSQKDNMQLFDENMKKLGNKLKEGNTLEVGQRGCNKVSAMAEQLIHKLERPKQPDVVTNAKLMTSTRPVFELPKKGRIDLCHFCKETVYVVERMTAEGKFFHRNCFRCEYCNTSLRIGNYVFDREGRYGERFYCSPHFQTVKMYGWKKFEVDRQDECIEDKYANEVHSLLVPPVSQQILSEMDERGTTPERVEFENSVDFASEEELLNEMDEDEWTDRNFGASNADNTSDEASDLSDEEITPDGNKDGENNEFPSALVVASPDPEVEVLKKEVESSDSDTEVASEDEEDDAEGSGDEEGSYEEEEGEDEEDEDEDEYEEECGGSTTEIETDSEFAEDPPHSVPGSIPTIIVDAPEQLLTKLIDAGTVNHTRNVPHNKKEPKANVQQHNHQRKYKDLYTEDPGDHSIEMVKKGGPERQLPVVTPVPKKWEPLSNNPERLASKMSLELKKKYLHGGSIPPVGITKKATDPAAQNQFRSVLDMISEQQKLLQPAAKPSATMQAFLDGAEKLKNNNKAGLSQINRNLSFQPLNLNSGNTDVTENAMKILETSQIKNNGNIITTPPQISSNLDKTVDATVVKKEVLKSAVDSLNFTKDFTPEELEKNKSELSSLNKELTPSSNEPNMGFTVTITSTEAKDDAEILEEQTNAMMMVSFETPSISNSETNTTSTVINVHDKAGETTTKNEQQSEDEDVESGSDTEVGSGEPFSDLDDLDYDEPPRIQREPPRVEIEDEFGVTQALEVTQDKKQPESLVVKSSSRVHRRRTKDVKRLDDGLDEGCSSSSTDSSLNSGIFLETEMSDYVKEEESTAENKLGSHKKKSTTKKHGHKHDKEKQNAKIGNTEITDSISKAKASLCFDLEAMDFADIDGISSPEDGPLQKVGQKLLDYSPTPESIVSSKESVHVDDQGIPPDSIDIQSSSSTSDSTSEDDDRSSTSAKDVHDQSTSEADVSENVMHHPLKELPKPPKISFSAEEILSKEEFPSLERVGPFSGARDSLDYRKAKGTTSHLRNKDLYSTYSVRSSKGSVPNGENPSLKYSLQGERVEETGEQELGPDDTNNPPIEKPTTTNCGHELPSLPISSDESSNRSTGSPATTRKLNEIHQERVKQNDLIRSMVMGRIKRSPEKGTRKNSKGSSSGTSLHSEAAVEKSGDEADSRVSSDNSQCLDENLQDDCLNNEDLIKTYPNTSQNELHSSSDESGVINYIPHRPMAESITTNSDDSSASKRSAKVLLTPLKVQPNYEPVFASSPRFRNRPKFDGPLSNNHQQQSVTEPPTPTVTLEESPKVNVEHDDESRRDQAYSSVRNPLFYRSMPDLINRISSVNKENINSQRTLELQSESPLVDEPSKTQVKVEEEPLPRLKHKTESTNLAGAQFLLDQKNKKDASALNERKAPTKAPRVFADKSLPVKTHEDINASSSSHKSNPFIVSSSPQYESLSNENEHKIPQFRSFDNSERSQDDFINLHLRFRSKDRPSERRLSSDKTKSMYQESTKEYFDPRQYSSTTSSALPHQSSYESKASELGNWILEKHDSSGGRPRANTLADLHFNETQASNSGRGSNSFHANPTNNSHFAPSVRHSIDNSDATKPSKSKALSSDTLLDPSPLSENACRSVPDICANDETTTGTKVRKGKDRDRRRSLIQTVSDFFTIRTNPSERSPTSTTGQSSSLTTSTSSSSIVSPSKERFSFLKLTPKLLQSKDKKNASKSKESVAVSSSGQQQQYATSRIGLGGSNDNYGRLKTDFSAYFAQPDLVIQRLTSSPNSSKGERTSQPEGQQNQQSSQELDSCAQNMATLSIVTTSPRDNLPKSLDRIDRDQIRNEASRAREIEEIQLQLESIESDQRALEIRGVKIEKKLRGEEQDENNRNDNDIMEEWFILVREKTRLARFEKELLVRAQELELEARREQLEGQLEKSQLLNESEKTGYDKQREIDILQQLRKLDEQHSLLLNSIHSDMEKYKSEDSNAEQSISPATSRLESDV